MGEENFETKTNLLSCENMVEYLWRKCDKESTPFKPEGAKDIHSEVTYADQVYGGEILKKYLLSKPDYKESNITKSEEYDFDTVSFSTSDENGNVLSEGTLVLIHRPDKKYYGLFLLIEEGSTNTLKLLVKAKQKKKLFDSFKTEVVTFY